jgi:protein TonB
MRGYFGRHDRPIRGSLLASVWVHLILLLVFTVAPIRSREIQLPPSPLVVSLIRAEEPEPPKVVRKSVPQKKPAPKPKPPPEPKSDAPKIQERIKRTEPETAALEPDPPVPPPTPAPPDTLAPQPSASVRLDMAARIDEAAFTFDYYLPQVVAKISRHWMQPAGLVGRDGGPTATLGFRIDRRGQVSRLEIESPSPVRLFDRSARDAVATAQPFPPLPPAYGGDYLTVHVRFVFTESRTASLR